VSHALAISLLHWLRLPERVNFKLHAAHGIPSVERNGATYTVSEPTRSGIKPARSSPSAVVVHAAAAHHAVPTTVCQQPAVARFLSQSPFLLFWSTLPDDVQSAPSVSSFR